MATYRLTSQMLEDGGVESRSSTVRACASGTTPHRRTAAVKLAAKIFTALAIALAISYVAARDYTPDASAAVGKIDVLNVGTCYATSSDVFGEADCIDNVDGDDEYDLDSGSNAGIQGLETAATVYATYADDPKTSGDNPRGILKDSDLVMVSILDAGRDKRTPVLLSAGVGTLGQLYGAQSGVAGGPNCYTATGDRDLDAKRGGTQDGFDREICAVYNLVNKDLFRTDPKDRTELLDPERDQTFVNRDATSDTSSVVEFTDSRASGNVVEVQLNGDTDYLPLHRKFTGVGTTLTKDTQIRFYGYLVSSSTTPKGGCTPVASDSEIADIGTIGVAHDSNNEDTTGVNSAKICDLTPLVRFDEDIGSGSATGDVAGVGAVAPWITFGITVGTGDKLVVRYVYYETSEREVLIGGRSGVSSGGTAYPSGQDAFKPVFTDDEASGKERLELQAATDEGEQHVWLRETGRFTGRYEGFVRLTDANGIVVRVSGQNEDNWGRERGDAEGPTVDDAAVVGAQHGPLDIKYRDSDGTTQEISVEIDAEPPEISVELPAYKANFEDQRVRVVGTFSDGESKLREDSFRMFMDNTNDVNENGETGNPVFEITVDDDGTDDDGGAYGCVDIKNEANAADPLVQVRGDYIGYTAASCSRVFGVVAAPDLFKPTENDDGDQLLAVVDPDDFDDGAIEGIFDDIARLDIEVGANADLNNTVDFQGFVLDIAGNIGFSDSDDAGPTFINDYGTRLDDRKELRYNVLGWYSRHIVSIDQQDPRLGRAVTGFYGENDDEEPLANVRGVMLLFDGAIDATSVDESTFKVELDPVPGSDPVSAQVVDVDVVGDVVYLLVSEEFAPNATPTLSVNTGREVRDPAGNSLTSNDDIDGIGDEARESEAVDGIPPTLQVSLSSGSGNKPATGEGPSSLTKDSIIVSVSSNENLSGRPHLSFVCDDFSWVDDMGTAMDRSDDVTWDLKMLLENRRGKLGENIYGEMKPHRPADADSKTSCGDVLEMYKITPQTAYSRPGNTWQYEWQNPDSGELMLPDGDVTVVAFARDATGWSDSYASAVINSYNWGASTAVFELDSELHDPTRGDTDANIAMYGSVQPRDGSDVFEARPFVLLTFEDKSTVFVDEFMIDGTVVEINSVGDNRFLHWPESLSYGKHKVEVEAIDAAGNERDFSYEFDVKERTAFEIELLAGWNAVSVPAGPVNQMLSEVFTIDEVDQVVTWESSSPQAPWRIATKVDGVWTTSEEFAPLTEVVAGKGYWVHSNGFQNQAVMLAGIPSRESAANAPSGPVGIVTLKGWNFVGVVDTDGDQTQKNDFNEDLKNSGSTVVTAADYLKKYKQAYVWDTIKSQFNVVESGDSMKVGLGVWVYYADDFNLAP